VLLADDRVFTVDVVRVIAVARGRAALIASDPTFAALPLRLTMQTPLYWWLENYGIAPMP